jgi:formylmethanofuran dehydrogenase subunit A
VVLRVKPEKASQIKSQVINGQKCLVIPMGEDEHATINGVNTTV